MMFLIDGMSTPIPNATVANTILMVDVGIESSYNVSSFIAVVCGAWCCAKSLFSGISGTHAISLPGLWSE